MPRKLDSATLTDEQLEELAAIGLTDEEISNLLGISRDGWRVSYPSVIKKGRARLRQTLRRAQIKAALNGNASLLIWLGKQYLGQKDGSSLEISGEHRALSITPNVLERLQTSYKLTMDQMRTRALPLDGTRAPAHEEEGVGVPRDREGVLKTVPLPMNSDLKVNANGESIAHDD